MIRIKPLKDFRGRMNEGKQGFVEAGVETFVEDKRRARDLESRGLAVLVRESVVVKKKEDGTSAIVSAPVKNEAAAAGPLGTHGGRTGADSQPSSSPPAQAQQRPPLFSLPRRANQE